MDAIFAEWAERKHAPLIVCDGNSEQKQRAIGSSTYLSTVVSDALPASGPTAVLFGWALGDQEDHILRKLGGGSYKRLAVSVHRPDTDRGRRFVENATAKLSRVGITEVVFFDAGSPGSWAVPHAQVAEAGRSPCPSRPPYERPRRK